ncbi:copper-binding protein [Microbaculum sp. FT89]|uniref:copper-binding protein n=1 Tax=Microbaculum sp. FT89 TaxID=3447298 RepID=UPI003F52EFD3
MSYRLSVPLAAALTLSALGGALATEYTKGVVKSVDLNAGKVTVIHEELKNLEMPAMTMVFVAGDDAILARIQDGQEIEFIADRVKGKLTIIELK